MIEVSNLTKKYGEKTGIHDLSFTVSRGEILGLLGPNGAGKTTTMNIITGYKPPTDGKVIIDGYDLSINPLEVKKRIGYLPEIPPLYPELKVRSYLRFVSDLKGVKPGKREGRITEIMELVKITEVSDRLIKNLSKGFKQRVGLAQALISNPAVLILDEPTVGLDPKQIMEIRSMIKSLGQEHTIILSSHILAEVSMVCERVIIINKGEIAAIDTPGNLAKSLMTSERFLMRIKGPRDQVRAIIQRIMGVLKVEDTEFNDRKSAGFFDYIIENEKSFDVKTPLFTAMAQNGYVIHEMRSLDLSLEDIFLQLTAEDQDQMEVH